MISIQGSRFVDHLGRTALLRGVNLGGSSKIPRSPGGATHRREGFSGHRQVSFVGRPLPLAEADAHFGRLREWGFELVRLLVCWEAVEHAGPGRYDEEYLDYLRRLAAKAAEHGLSLFIDPHQDVWSRFTGGDGAPGWTLEAVGFDLASITAAGAAVLHQDRGDPFPWLTWPTNYTKLAAATMFTLFFGGDLFAPRARVDGVPVQEHLQGHYARAFRQVALRLRDLPNVVGYGTMNEPSPGFIGVADIRGRPRAPLFLGESPTVLQAMALGAGLPQSVELLAPGLLGTRHRGRRLVNPAGRRAWREGADDPWRAHGVWDLGPDGAPRALRPRHFIETPGGDVDFGRDCFRPFVNRFAREIRAAAPGTVIFIEGPPAGPAVRWQPGDAPRVVHAPHWYDGVTMATHTFRRWIGWDLAARRPLAGERAIRRSLARQVGELIRQSAGQVPGAPVLIAEVGIPFNMQRGRAYRTGDFSMQARAMDASMQALERNLASHAIWNYTADNTNERGDQWNGEDFSLFSPDQERAGSDRAASAAVRPWPRRVAGEPLEIGFDLQARRFTMRFRHDPAARGPTEIFVPRLHYPGTPTVEVSDGDWDWRPGEQLLLYRHTDRLAEHRVTLRPPAG